MTNVTQLRKAHALGHQLGIDYRASKSQHPDALPKFHAQCSCGWGSIGYRLEAAALDAARHHARKAIALARDNGR